MMTQEPVPALIRRLAVPTVISMLVTGLYNSADTFFVGRISTGATAAVGLVFPVMAIIQAFGFFCGQGSAIYLSRMLGAGNQQEADEMASTGFCLALLLGLITAAAGNLFARPIAAALGADADTLADTLGYMRIILCGAPFIMSQFVINNQLRFQGSALYAMFGLLAGAMLNVVLDPILILGLHMGTQGAALATVAGQIVSFFVLWRGYSLGSAVHIRRQDVHFSRHYLGEIINGGTASLARQGLASLSTIFLNVAASRCGGAAAIAGMSITSRVTMLIVSAVIGFGQGYQPVCSFNYGAGLTGRVREGYLYCVKVGTVFLLVFSCIAFIFAPSLTQLFRDDPEVIAVGARALRYQCVPLFLMAFSVLTNMLLQSTGRGLKASITSSARNGIFFLPLILILPRLLGLTGVMLAQPVSDVCSAVLALVLVLPELRALDRAAGQGRPDHGNE